MIDITFGNFNFGSDWLDTLEGMEKGLWFVSPIPNTRLTLRKWECTLPCTDWKGVQISLTLNPVYHDNTVLLGRRNHPASCLVTVPSDWSVWLHLYFIIF